jgi:hypothetical protein
VQLVEIRETVQDIIVPTYVTAAQPASPKARLFEHVAEETLLSYGVPAEWLQDVRQAAVRRLHPGAGSSAGDER